MIKFILVLCCLPALVSSQVCVFDLDGTLLGTDRKLDENAINACVSQGYELAVNTAEPYNFCYENRPHVEQLGLTVPDEMYLCYDESQPTAAQSKIANMDRVAKYYSQDATCVLLFDDLPSNINAVEGTGYGGEHINTTPGYNGISPSELDDAMNKLKECNEQKVANGVKYRSVGNLDGKFSVKNEGDRSDDVILV